MVVAVFVVDYPFFVLVVRGAFCFFIMQYPRYLRGAFALYGKGKYAPHNGHGLGVDYPFFLVVRVGHIAVYAVPCDRLDLQGSRKEYL